MPPTEPTEKEIAEIRELLRSLLGKPPVKECAKKIKQRCKALHKQGWKKITVHYSGSGDSCDDFESRIANEEGEMAVKDVEWPDPAFVKQLEDELWELLPSGFENNEGGAGTIEVDVKTGRITVEHDQYYTESTHSKDVY